MQDLHQRVVSESDRLEEETQRTRQDVEREAQVKRGGRVQVRRGNGFQKVGPMVMNDVTLQKVINLLTKNSTPFLAEKI